jgi:hypothetical protein
MSDLIIPEPLASRLREFAERDRRQPQEVIAAWLDEAEIRAGPEPPDYPVYAPRPPESLPDDAIDVPEEVADKAAYRQAVRELLPKLYAIAREYWASVGDTDRLALTDEDLDQVFWLIDHEGVPRFKSEMATYLPPDDLGERLIGLIDTDDTSLSLRRMDAHDDRAE